MSSNLHPVVQEWSRQLDFFAPDVTEDWSRMLALLDEALPWLPAPAAEQEPAGWAGLSRRGRWSQLVPTQWALLETAPDEFLRRAGQGELQFWMTAYQGAFQGQDSWLVFDSGPEQLGACRLVQLGLLLLFHRRAQQLGRRITWSLAQFPDRAYDELAAWSVRAFLQGRSLEMPGPPQAPGSDDRIWFVGGRSWRGNVPGPHEFIELDSQGPESVELRWRGRRVELRMPPSERALRLFRDPFSLGSRSSQAKACAVPGDMVFSNCGRKVLLVDEQQITVFPVPQSPREPLGKSRRFQLPAGRAVALGWLQGALTCLTRDDPEPGAWSLRRLNPAREAESGRLTLPPWLTWEGQLGTCRAIRGGVGYRLWLEGRLWDILGSRPEQLHDRGSFQGGRLVSPSMSLFVRDGQVFDDALKVVFDLRRSAIAADQARQVLIGYGAGLSVPGVYAVLALEAPKDRWTLMWKGETAQLDTPGGRILGVVPWSSRGLALVEQRPQGIRFYGPQVEEWLETGPLHQAIVSPLTGVVAWRGDSGLGYFSPSYAASLGAS